MIYAICITQLLTVAGAVLAVKWILDHLEAAEQKQRTAVDATLAYMQSVSESSQATLREIVTQSNEQVQRVIDQAYRDREILCERIQFPTHMQAQAPSADKGAKTKPHTMDEEREFEIEHPGAEREPVPVGAVIPGARPEDDELKPVPTVKPFGQGRSNGSTE